MKLNLLTGILLTSLISNADNTTIGGVDMGEVKNSDAFNQVKKCSVNGRENFINNLE